MTQIWHLTQGDSPLVATAIHDGHNLRTEVAAIMALPDLERLREEDPFTGNWANVADNRLIGSQSRFEVDLNRPREKAVYIQPEDAWGLHVWQETPSAAIIEQSLANYDAFYAEAHRLFSDLEKRFNHFVVFDLHTYKHRREGPNGALADAALVHGGRVTGIIPHFMVVREWQHKGVKDMVHVETMAERKQLLVKDVDAVIVLPGGKIQTRPCRLWLP